MVFEQSTLQLKGFLRVSLVSYLYHLEFLATIHIFEYQFLLCSKISFFYPLLFNFSMFMESIIVPVPKRSNKQLKDQNFQV